LVHSGDGINDTNPGNSNDWENPDKYPVSSDDHSLWEEDLKQAIEEEISQDPALHRQIITRRIDIPTTSEIHSSEAVIEDALALPQTLLGGPFTLLPILPDHPVSSLSTHDTGSQPTDTPASNTHGPAQAAAKTSQTSCTPSPTESLPPSASM
jgi:hypothetical protein